MKVGDYVRTEKGIAKIIGKNDDVRFHYPDAWETDTYLEINDDTEYVYDEDIIKSSPNIIDLIEAGDYVNGVEVTEIKDGKPFKEDYNDPYYSYYFDDIYSIVTKEQFESMEYKVGE